MSQMFDPSVQPQFGVTRKRLYDSADVPLPPYKVIKTDPEEVQIKTPAELADLKKFSVLDPNFHSTDNGSFGRLMKARDTALLCNLVHGIFFELFVGWSSTGKQSCCSSGKPGQHAYDPDCAVCA